MRELELLAPARSGEFGIEAIRSGADAVYIGGPNFGARAAAASSLEEIEALVAYAHCFSAKVYVVINTILFDSEIAEVEAMVHKLYKIGVDALIVQDMAFARMNIPAIPLFASTQMTNLTIERVRQLESMGFSRIILERALSLEEISDICGSVDVDIETFIHGAICVSHSGSCYMSQYVSNRSANRGVCSQPCRSTYNLVNSKGEVLLRDKHLLSLKDLSLEHHIPGLITAGVTSFKIEGRLKDIVYLKNVTAYYNNILNSFIKENSTLYKRASYGSCKANFTPNLNKSFSRSFTSYFLGGKGGGLASFDSGKSVGEYIGEVVSVAGGSFTLDKLSSELVAGDGLCFFTPKGAFAGSYVNVTQGRKVTPAKIDGITVGAKIYRNLDKLFVHKVSGESTERLLKVDTAVDVIDGHIHLHACSESGVVADFTSADSYEPANNIERANDTIRQQMAKSGGTIFNVSSVKLLCDAPFVPMKHLNEMRRELLSLLELNISKGYKRGVGNSIKDVNLGVDKLDYKANISNHLAEEFYSACGVKSMDKAVELTHDFSDVELMRTTYCLRREIGRCLKEGADKEVLFLENNKRLFGLKFDCKLCQMVVVVKK